jgi:hypothetical protein
MTAHEVPAASIAHRTAGAAPVPGERSIVHRLWQAVVAVAHGIDAGALVAHGREVPPDHPSRRRRLDHEEVERRLTELYPRS